MSDTAPAAIGAVRRRRGLHIQSKLLIMLLVVSILAAAVVGVIGYLSGRDSLRDAALQQVTALRESRASELERTYASIRQAVILDSRNHNAVEATRAFEAGWQQLQTAKLSAADVAKVDAYYADTFVPDLQKQTGDSTEAALFEPTDPAEQYLQLHYTVPYTDFDAAIANDDAGDGSAWSAAHAQYHDYFRALVEQLGYEDVLLLNTSGDVIYSAYKGVDLGTDVETGPYSHDGLASVYTAALGSNAIDSAAVTDFDPYQPSFDAPTAWMASPIGEGGQVEGVLAVQVPVQTIDDVMTDGGHWKRDGLGATGEAVLVGPDKTLRSMPRLLAEDPKAYRKAVVGAGTAPATADRQVETKSAVHLQPVLTTAVDRALSGRTGTVVSRDYEGTETLSAYAPVDIAGLQWVVVAKIDTSEAFAPVDDFTRNIVLSTAAIIVLIALLSLVLAQVFVRPVRALQTAVNRVSAGEVGAEIPVLGADEFGDLGAAFNDMSRNLKVKQDLLDDERRENERLLLTLMPEAVAERYRQGEETIAEEHQDVSVIFADLIGVDRFSSVRSTVEAVRLLNGLWKSFDEAAQRHGIEKVRNTQRSYLASSGLTVPRVDNARRVVEFAVELADIVQRFNAAQDAELGLRAGVDTGTVTSGLIGRTSVVFDMWGDAVNLAYRLQGDAPRPGIYATQRVIDKLADQFPVEEAGSVETQAGPQRVWRLEASAA